MELFLMHAAFWWKLGFGNSSAFFCSSNRWHLSSALLVWVVFKLVHSFIRSLWRCGRKITAHCGIFYWISFEKTALGHKLCSLLEFKLSKRSACFRSEKSGSLNISPKIWIALQRNSICWGKQASRQAWRNAVPSNPAVKCANWKSAREWISVSNPADSDKYQVNWKIKQKATFANIVDLVLLFSAIWGYTLKMIIEIEFEKCERISHKDLRDQ